MTEFMKNIYEFTEIINAFNMVIEVLKKEIDDLQTVQENMNILLDAQGVMAKTGWSLKTTQKAMRDPRMHTIWVSKGPQVTIKEFERYCALDIDRATDPY